MNFRATIAGRHFTLKSRLSTKNLRMWTIFSEQGPPKTVHAHSPVGALAAAGLNTLALTLLVQDT